MRFKDKTYIITLVLFLVFLNAGIFSLAFFTNQRNTDAAESLCFSEQAVIADAFEEDITYLGHNGRQLLMNSYGTHYATKGIGLRFEYYGELKYSSLPEGLVAPQAGYSSTQRVDGKRVFLITEVIADGQYHFTYAKDVSYLDEDFKTISVVFILTSFGASALLALILFLVLHKLYSPLSRLKNATEEIANGNFESRADDSGRDEFALLAADFNRMADRISTQMNELELNAETKQSMLDNLAHEMRTPLTSIRGYAEYLLNANIGEAEKIEAIEYIISESERLKQIGEKLLDDAFIRENGINTESVNLGEITAGAAKKTHFNAAAKGIDIKVEASSVVCKCDKLLTEMLITNLIGNAIKACESGGKIYVHCYAEGSFAVISVRDNGVGMTEEQLARITEPFYRIDKSRDRVTGGTGLGLALCERIVKAHNATLEFESALGKGTTVTARFPL